MNTQIRGDLSSDQEIEKRLYAFGYSILIGKDGRRLWPRKFKKEMAQKLLTKELTVADDFYNLQNGSIHRASVGA